MPDSPTTFVPFDLFGTTYSQTNELLSAFTSWFNTHSPDTAVEAIRSKVRALIDQHTSAGSQPRTFWNEAFDSVNSWKEKSTRANEGDEEESDDGEFWRIDMGLLPFTWAVEEEDRERLELHMGTWWTSNGSASKEEQPIPVSTPSSSRAASREVSIAPRRSSRSRSRSLPAAPVAKDPKNSPAPLPPSNPTETNSLAPPLSKRIGPRAPSTTFSDKESSLDPYEFQGNAQQIKPLPSFARNRPTSSSQAPHLSPPPPSHHTEAPDTSTVDDSERRRLFLARQQRNLADFRNSSSANIPPHLQQAYQDTEDMRHSDSDVFVKSTCRARTSIRMPLKCRMSTMRNEYVDFSEVNAYDPTVASAHRFKSMEDGTILSEPVADKKEIPSLPIWLDIWEIYSEWLCYWYPDFKPDHDFYKTWMRTQYRHDPENWKAYLAFDAFVRTNIATDSYPYTLQEFTLQTTILFRFINKQNSSSSSINSSSTSSSQTRKRFRPSDDPSTQICHRFNDNCCPGEPSCGGRSHRCENCGGDDHSGENCEGN
ncbi:hypothetical protein JCM5353_001683, partial [Sporobolomyces roseus]